MVLRLVPYVLGLTVIVLALWFLDRHALKTVDWGLLATFAAFPMAERVFFSCFLGSALHFWRSF